MNERTREDARGIESKQVRGRKRGQENLNQHSKVRKPLRSSLPYLPIISIEHRSLLFKRKNHSISTSVFVPHSCRGPSSSYHQFELDPVNGGEPGATDDWNISVPASSHPLKVCSNFACLLTVVFGDYDAVCALNSIKFPGTWAIFRRKHSTFYFDHFARARLIKDSLTLPNRWIFHASVE